MNIVVYVTTETFNTERRFDDKSAARVFANKMKETHPQAEVTVGERAPLWHSPSERRAYRASKST